MEGLRKILRVPWTAKKTNEWVLNKAGVNRTLLDTVKARKLTYYGHTMRKQGSCLEKEIMLPGTMLGARRQGRPRTACVDNIKTWTGLPADRGRLKNRTVFYMSLSCPRAGSVTSAARSAVVRRTKTQFRRCTFSVCAPDSLH